MMTNDTQIQKDKELLINHYVEEDKEKYRMQIKRGTKRLKLNHFYIKLTQHCNLNCKCCDEFSPLAEEEYIDEKILKNDFKRLAELTNSDVDIIILSGGETLLYKNIASVVEILKKYFPNTKIELFTNGTLLQNASEDFWKMCNHNKIALLVTVYPIDVDYDKIFKTAIKHRVVCLTQDNIDDSEVKTTWHLPMDLEGKQNPVSSFLNCMHANHCFYLNKGKLFPCSIAGNVRHFNKYFNKNLEVSPGDYIDIHKVKSLDEILAFLSNPVPFCRYCDVENRTVSNKWDLSDRDISEWTLLPSKNSNCTKH